MYNCLVLFKDHQRLNDYPFVVSTYRKHEAQNINVKTCSKYKDGANIENVFVENSLHINEYKHCEISDGTENEIRKLVFNSNRWLPLIYVLYPILGSLLAVGAIVIGFSLLPHHDIFKVIGQSKSALTFPLLIVFSWFV